VHGLGGPPPLLAGVMISTQIDGDQDQASVWTFRERGWRAFSRGASLAARDRKRGIAHESLVQEPGAQQRSASLVSHDPAKWKEFQQRYRAELADDIEACQSLLNEAKQQNITLL